jgi:hypothetical protein
MFGSLFPALAARIRVKNKDCACYYEKPSAYENPSRNHVPEACSGFQTVSQNFEIAHKAACDLENCSESRGLEKHRSMIEKESQSWNL